MAPEGFVRSLDGLQLVVSCLTADRLVFAPSAQAEQATDWTASFARPAQIRAHGLLRGSTLSVRVLLRVSTFEGPATMVGYAYSLRAHDGRELLAFHWHPDGRSPIVFPHLHVSAALRGTTPSGEAAVLPLDKVHVPTGRLTPADAVHMLVGELDVAPSNEDWRQRLDRAAAMLPAFPS